MRKEKKKGARAGREEEKKSIGSWRGGELSGSDCRAPILATAGWFLAAAGLEGVCGTDWRWRWCWCRGFLVDDRRTD